MAATTKRFLLPALSNPDYTPSIPNPDPYGKMIHLTHLCTSLYPHNEETIQRLVAEGKITRDGFGKEFKLKIDGGVRAIILEGDETEGKALTKEAGFTFNNVVTYKNGIIQESYPEDYIFNWYGDPSFGDERVYMLLDVGPYPFRSGNIPKYEGLYLTVGGSTRTGKHWTLVLGHHKYKR